MGAKVEPDVLALVNVSSRIGTPPPPPCMTVTVRSATRLRMPAISDRPRSDARRLRSPS